MSRNFDFSLGEFYHCYSRGVEKRKIFLNGKDYLRFIALLFACNSKNPIHLSDYQRHFYEIFTIDRKDTLVEIGAYCLMPNHLHLLLKEKGVGGISKFMQKLMTGYTMYFNKKYERTGSLFGSRFKAVHIKEDRYLKYIFSYIHLNPVKLKEPHWREAGPKKLSGVKKYLSQYEYSSYLDYLERQPRPQYEILNMKAFPAYFRTRKDFAVEIIEWLTYGKNSTVKVQP